MPEHNNFKIKMYDCRNRLKDLLGESFPENCNDCKTIIHAAMKLYKTDNVLDAAMQIMNHMDEMDDKEIANLWILATCLEMIEPSY